jgi:hypothetical protein
MVVLSFKTYNVSNGKRKGSLLPPTSDFHKRELSEKSTGFLCLRLYVNRSLI